MKTKVDRWEDLGAQVYLKQISLYKIQAIKYLNYYIELLQYRYLLEIF